MTQSRTHPFLVLSANTPWVHALAEKLAYEVPGHAVRFYDWRVYWREQPEWPEIDDESKLRRTLRVMPTGYAGRLEWLARPFLRRMIDGWRADLRDQTSREPYVVAPYPYLAPWVRNVPARRLIYYNLDDYVQYRPARREKIRGKEEKIIERAHRTVCLARYQVERFREWHPEHAGRIHHFPLGVVEGFVNRAPDPPLEPKTVTYVGNMTDRVDWSFVDEVVERCTDLTFRFVGGIDQAPGAEEPWRVARRRVLGQENVKAVGRVSQSEVVKYYWESGANWIPYDPDHPFNVASCPTKIMDGLASGRPLVSTPVPECTLYPDWVDVADAPDAMAALLRKQASTHNPDRARRQVAFARQHTWGRRADTLRAMLAEDTLNAVSRSEIDTVAER